MFLAGKLEEHYANFVSLRDLLRVYGGYGEEDVMLGEIRLVEVRSRRPSALPAAAAVPLTLTSRPLRRASSSTCRCSTRTTA